MVLKNLPRGLPYSTDPDKDKIPKAQWGLPEAILKSQNLKWDPSKIMLGSLNDQLIGLLDDRHICTVAGSRSGKGVSAIIPNLIHYQGSALCIDPKGELASITARRRAFGLGQKVSVLDPFERAAPWCAPYKVSFNPLSVLTPDNPTIVEDAGLIADSLVVASVGTNVDPHWDESARALIEAVILHVITCPKYTHAKNLITVYELLTRGSVYSYFDDESQSERQITGFLGLLLEMIENAGTVQNEDVALIIEGTAIDMQDRGDKERGSVLSTVHRNIKFIGYRSIQQVLVDNPNPQARFSLEELKTSPAGMTIYLCLPAGRMGTCNRWLRLFINLTLERMERLGQKPPTSGLPVLFVLDEFPILGHMRQIEDAAGQIASFHVKLWFVIQDLTQLQNLYEKRWQSFLGNCGILQLFGNADLETLEYIQKRLGKTPVRKRSQSVAAAKAVSDVSFSEEMHDLITAEEAARFFSRDDRYRRQLVIWTGHDPMILQRVVYYDKASPLYQYFGGQYDEWQG